MTNYPEASDNDIADAPAAYSVVDSDDLKLQRFLLWLEEHGAHFNNVRLETRDGLRNAYAVRALQAGEQVMHIPLKLIITPEVARASRIGQLLVARDIKLGDNGFLAAFLLEVKREGGFWKPYIDVLPTDYGFCPIAFNDTDLAYLTGSAALQTVHGQRARIQWEHRQLVQLQPADSKCTLDEYIWARTATTTRTHSLLVHGVRTIGLVPFADMLNHASTDYVRWVQECTIGFGYAAQEKVEAGAPLNTYYGDKGNTQLFTSYGFCLPHNTANEAVIDLPEISSTHSFASYVSNTGEATEGIRRFAVRPRFDVGSTIDTLTYLRSSFLETPPDGIDLSIAAGADKIAVPPSSRMNEIAVLTSLAAACERALSHFETTIEQDDELLQNTSLANHVLFAIQVRRDEKTVLQFFIDLAKVAVPILQDPACPIGTYATPPYRFCGYFRQLERFLKTS